jgi:hypothetical protein
MVPVGVLEGEKGDVASTNERLKLIGGDVLPSRPGRPHRD